jgi:predicted DNA-binding WGR domain protein
MITPVAYLEARDPTHNVHRAYSIAYGQDLFGNWVVETTYGRIGAKGRTIVTVVNNEEEALNMCKKRLNVGSLPLSGSALAMKFARHSIWISSRLLKSYC